MARPLAFVAPLTIIYVIAVAVLLPCNVAADSSKPIWEQEQTPAMLVQLRREWFPPPRPSARSIPSCGTKRDYEKIPSKRDVGHFFLTSSVDKKAAERYDTIRVLGRGAQGLVIMALDKLKGGVVAIKKAGLKGSARELKLLQALQGSDDIEKVENVLMPRDPKSASSIYVAYERMVMPMHKMHTMWGSSHHEVPKSAMQRILFSIVRAVHYMHTNGVVHLDIKPENVMIAADCSPRIVDLGIARRLYDSKGNEVIFGGNAVKHGSHPPEYTHKTIHSLGRLKLGADMAKSSDLWSLGMVLLSALHGGRPLARFREVANMKHEYYGELLGAMLGRPGERALKKHYADSLQKSYMRQSKTPKIPMWKVFPNVDRAALKMVMRLLRMDPEARTSAKDILRDPYFKSVRESAWYNPATADKLKPDPRISELLNAKKNPAGGQAALVYELSLAYSPEAEAAFRANTTPRGMADAL
eukprot:jgi/Tetstr1/458046/TSEL_044554.t1